MLVVIAGVQAFQRSNSDPISAFRRFIMVEVANNLFVCLVNRDGVHLLVKPAHVEVMHMPLDIGRGRQAKDEVMLRQAAENSLGGQGHTVVAYRNFLLFGVLLGVLDLIETVTFLLHPSTLPANLLT